MSTPSQLPQVLQFGVFEIDARAGELRKSGVKLKLQEQPFQLLCMLVEHTGEVVTREELRGRLWAADTFVDFDHSLNAAVKRLRDTLGDSAENPVFIETLARRGYRFIGSISGSPEEVAKPAKFRSSFLAGSIGSYRTVLASAAVVIVTVLAILSSVSIYGRRPGLGEKRIESLAVLPLENLSRDLEQEYFSTGMTDALIAQLSQAGALRVASRTSVMRYKGTKKSLPEIARELHVDGVIEGSVLRSGNRIRIVAQLIQARTDQQLWAESYERDLTDILGLQAEVAQAIVKQVRSQLAPGKQAPFHSTTTVHPEAYEAYLKGCFYRDSSNTKAGIKKAQDYFQNAIRKDPNFAAAYAGLADSYLDLGSYRWMPPQEAYRYGNAAVLKALELDETLGEAHSTLGYLSWQYAWDWQRAEAELRRSIDLNPNYLEGHEGLAWYLAWSGRSEDALAEIEKIRKLDPVRTITLLDVSGVYYHRRDYKLLIDASQKSMVVNPDQWSSHYFLGVGREGAGQLAEAIPEYQKAVEMSQNNTDAVAGLAHAYAASGRRVEARKILDELNRQTKSSYVSPYMVATIHAGMGEREKAFEFLERAYRERSPDIPYFLKADLRVDVLRADPRFQDLLRRVGLPQ
jgi:TolB-like protein/DNA-binding winged helix-turn-helix (wHTH) protein/Flp pilus assembly protein TadD